jgi:magnesium transporter
MVIGTWYGMNFEHMPELRGKYSYLSAFAVTVLSTIVTWWYFKKKKWF